MSGLVLPMTVGPFDTDYLRQKIAATLGADTSSLAVIEVTHANGLTELRGGVRINHRWEVGGVFDKQQGQPPSYGARVVIHLPTRS